MTDPIQVAVDEFVAKLRKLIRAEAYKAVGKVLGADAGSEASETFSEAEKEQIYEEITAAPVKALPAPKPTPKKSPPKAAKAPQAKVTPKKKEGGKRVRRSQDQIEATGRKIIEYVAKHPGTGAETIKADLRIPKAEWGKPIEWAVKSGGVKTKGQRRATVYLPGGGK